MTEPKKYKNTVADQMESKATNEKTKDNTFLLFQEEKISFQQFYERSSAYAQLFLKLHQQAAAGDQEVRVAVFMDNHPVFLYAFGGCALTGGTLFGVNTGLRGEVLTELLNKARCQCLIVDDRHYERVRDIRDKLEFITPDRIFLLETDVPEFEAPSGLRSVDEALEAVRDELGDLASARPAADPSAETNLMVIYTSGTTGLPKGIKNSQRKLMTLGTATGGMIVGAKPEDVGYACMPLFHSNSMFLAVMTAFVYNASVVIKDRFSASGFLPDILKYGVTFWNYVGQPVHYILLALERQYGSEEKILAAAAQNPKKKLRVAFGNGASSVDQEKFIRYFGLSNMMESYGTTEMAIAVIGHKDNPRGSVGMIMDPGVKIYNENNQECPPADYDENGRFQNYTEAVGEIVRLGGPLPAFEGYHDNPQEESKKIRDGVYHSGDLGHIRVIQNRRFLYFDGRTDDWIRKDGENFSAESVAQVVAGFAPVALAAAYGVPCPVSDEWVMAAVKLHEGQKFDPEAFHQYLEKQCSGGDMDRKWIPEFVRVVNDFEYTRTQKILARPLKHEYFNLEWIPEGTIYFYRRGFDTYRPFTRAELEALLEEFKKTGREQLLETWR
ncbi:MAG: hypothetical protein A2V67_09020 [Deltaproteobacteria bacterium RBG_13_61_14]|nr:MAG: hypothetical protein A2V67_09020 [Deltaproteobacteria bacterium RBG_13_61_14]